MRFKNRCWFDTEIMLIILSDLRCRNNANRRPELRVNHKLKAYATRTEQPQAGSLGHANRATTGWKPMPRERLSILWQVTRRLAPFGFDLLAGWRVIVGGVGRVVNFSQAFDRHVRVELSRGELRMTQQRLQTTNVSTVF